MTIWQRFAKLSLIPAWAWRRRTVATIGRSIRIKGEIRGAESLRIDGRVEGRILLPGQAVTVGKSGCITAKVEAGEVAVRGEVVGNITATDKIEIGREGSVLGNMLAGRVVLVEGSTFRGRINSEESRGAGQASWQECVLDREIDDVLHCAFPAGGGAGVDVTEH